MKAKKFENAAILGAVFVLCCGFLSGFYDKANNLFSLFTYVIIFCVLLWLALKRNINLLLLSTWGLVPISQHIEISDTGSVISFPTEILGFVLSLYLISALLLNSHLLKFLRHPFFLLVGIDIAWLLICTATSSDAIVSLKRSAVRINFYLFALVLPYFFMRNKKWLLKLPFLYILGLAPVIAAILYHHSKYSFASFVAFAIPSPYFDDHTVYGAVIAFSIPLLLVFIKKQKKWLGDSLILKLISLSFLILFLVGFFFSYSRAAWLSIVVAIVFAALLYFKVKVHQMALIFVLLAFISAFAAEKISNQFEETEAVSNDGNLANHLTSVTNVSTDASNLERINRWVCAYRMGMERPIFGFGPGTYQFEYAQFQTKEFTTRISTRSGDRGNAHSEYLNYLAENGWIGLLIFLSIAMTTIYYGLVNNLQLTGDLRLINNTILLSLITFFFHGLFNSFLDQDKMAVPVFSGMAAIVALHKFHTGKKNLVN